MIKTDIVIETRKLSDLSEWDKNPRSINGDAFERLKQQIVKLGVYKPLIVDQNNVIIGGNMRFKALVALNVKEVSVIVHHCKDDTERVEIALSDNDRAGYYNETEVAELVQMNGIDAELYSIDMTESKTIKEIIDAEPLNLGDEKEVDTEDLLKGDHLCECPRCGFEFDPKQKNDDDETE